MKMKTLHNNENILNEFIKNTQIQSLKTLICKKLHLEKRAFYKKYQVMTNNRFIKKN